MALLLSLWNNPIVRTILLYGALAAVLAGFVLMIYFNGKAAGKLAVTVDNLNKQIAGERRVKDAQASGPNDVDDAVDRLHKHTF